MSQPAPIDWTAEDERRAIFREGLLAVGEHPMTPSDPTPPDDALLRLLAREAMSVGWYSEGFFRSLIDEDDDSLIEDADARFMAAVTPSVVLALLDLAALPATPTLRDTLRDVIGYSDEDHGLEHWHHASGGRTQPTERDGVFVDRQQVLDVIDRVLG